MGSDCPDKYNEKKGVLTLVGRIAIRPYMHKSLQIFMNSGRKYTSPPFKTR
jgi:hypothetical protein